MSGNGENTLKRGSNQPPLPRLVQEHLGQKLRAQLYEVGEKPQYLGDPVIPKEFDHLIERIENKMPRPNQAQAVGYLAVAAALRDFRESDATSKATDL